MTDNDIIKALECCSKITFSCDGCPLKHLKYSECYELVIRSTLDLINRQKAEIEKCENIIRLADKTIEKQSAEIKRLEQENFDRSLTVETWKVEAVKEFAERLCDGRPSNDPVVIEVKVELKEMVGDTDATN